jgi:hypothetical protein
LALRATFGSKRLFETSCGEGAKDLRYIIMMTFLVGGMGKVERAGGARGQNVSGGERGNRPDGMYFVSSEGVQ